MGVLRLKGYECARLLGGEEPSKTESLPSAWRVLCGLPGELVHNSYVQFSRARPPEGVHELAKWHGQPKMADTGKQKAALRKHHTALVFVSVTSRLPALRPTHVGLHVHGT